MRQLLLALTLLIACHLPLAGQQYPTIYLEYSPPFEARCRAMSDIEVPAAWEDELLARFDEFQEAWDAVGLTLLQAVVEQVGRPFRERDITGILTLCGGGAISLPLLIGAEDYLVSASGDDAAPLSGFPHVVFHEVLHYYVVDWLRDAMEGGVAPALFEKYQNEPPLVLNHLHLTALLKEVYLELELPDALALMEANYRRLGRGYARALEIVNEIEGHEAFLSELRGS